MIQDNLFISSFKKYKKNIWTILSPIVFLFILALCHRLLWYTLVDDTGSYTRIMIHELYNQEKNVDILFLGSSHCYRTLVTDVTDDIFEANTFNAGTSAQEWDGSYALLLEADKMYDLEKVYIEMYYEMAGKNYSDRRNMIETHIISDYMKPSFNRVRYLLESGGMDNWIYGFFPERRNWYKIFERQYVSDLLNKKFAEDYRRYAYIGNPDTDTEYYAGKGFVANNSIIENEGYFAKEHFYDAGRIFSKDDINTLNKIIIYCQKHNIELVFFSAPVPDFTLVDAGNYDTYILHIKEYTEKYGVPYYDFNLCKPEYFSYDSSFFKDNDHLNMKGAEIFSRVFADFFNGKISEKDLFYTSYEEKLDKMGKRFLGVIYSEDISEDTKIITLEPVKNEEFEYQMVVSKKVRGTEMYERVQMGEAPTHIVVPQNETGQLRICVFDDIESIHMTNEIMIEY